MLHVGVKWLCKLCGELTLNRSTQRKFNLPTKFSGLLSNDNSVLSTLIPVCLISGNYIIWETEVPIVLGRHLQFSDVLFFIWTIYNSIKSTYCVIFVFFI